MPLAIAKLITTNQYLQQLFLSDEFVVNGLDDPDSASPLCVYLNCVLNIHALNYLGYYIILSGKKKNLPVKTLTTALFRGA